jgi:hypothetical protein
MQVNMVFVLIPWQTPVLPAEPLPCYRQWHHCPISRICSCFQLQNSGVPKWHYSNVVTQRLSTKYKECVLGGSHKHAEDCQIWHCVTGWVVAMFKMMRVPPSSGWTVQRISLTLKMKCWALPVKKHSTTPQTVQHVQTHVGSKQVTTVDQPYTVLMCNMTLHAEVFSS